MIVKEIISDTDSVYNYMQDEIVLGYPKNMNDTLGERIEKTEFGELLTRLIREKKMTQSYFYEKVGIAKPYFYDIL